MLAVQTVHASAAGPGSAPILRLLLPGLLVVLGLAVGVVGGLGLRGGLPRNRWAGVRTPATMRDDAAFELGNRVAGAPLLASAVIGVGSGILSTVMPTSGSALVVAGIGLLATLALVMAGGVLGHRAAATLPEPAASSCESKSACAGCTALCGLR